MKVMNKIRSRKEQLKRAKQTTKGGNCHKQLRLGPVNPFRQNPPNANVNKEKGKLGKQSINNKRGEKKKDEKANSTRKRQNRCLC